MEMRPGDAMPFAPSRQRLRTTAVYRTPNRAQARPRALRAGGRSSGMRRPVRKRSILLGVISIAAFAMFFVTLGIAAGQLVSGLQNRDMSGLQGAAIASLLAFLFPFLGLGTGLIGCFLASENRILAAVGAALNGIVLVWLLVNSLGNARIRAEATAAGPGYNATTASISIRPPLGSAATCTVARAG